MLLTFLFSSIFVAFLLHLFSLTYYVILVYFLYWTYRLTTFYLNQKTLQGTVDLVLHERQENFAKARKFASTVSAEVKQKIKSLNYSELKKCLISREITCVETLAAVIDASLDCQDINAVNFFILESIAMAQEWDKRALQDDFEFPTLFGVPISVKDCLNVKGYPTTLGYVSRAVQKSGNYSIVVEKVMKNGAIPFCKTNVPQTLLSFDCKNPIFGATLNPHNKSRTPGGSSGGDAALVAAKASFAGIGSDVGGSIRIPAAFSGCVGIKPGGYRYSHMNSTGSIPGRPYIEAAEGPLGQTVESCVDILSTIIDSNTSEDDPYIAPVPWRKQLFESTKKLRIGYFTTDGWFEPIPAVKRVVNETVDLLKQNGHTLIEFQPPEIERAFGLTMGAITVDGNQYILNNISNDILQPEYIPFLAPFLLPYYFRLFLAYTVGMFIPRIHRLMTSIPGSTSELRQVYAGIQDYRRQFVAAMKEKEIDLIIAPPNPGVACRIGEPPKLNPMLSYTVLYNMLDFPAGVLPVGTVNEADIEKMEDYLVVDFWTKFFKQSMIAQDVKGLPLAIQVIGPPFSEEIVCRLMTEINQYKN
uniref:Amidase domain-containing protein n=1 Tax=Panagrolaimus sp. JU765 TaxID=591449 RepID=A0AC34Q5B7_9BILA